MRRRPPSGDGVVPARLLRFDPAEWGRAGDPSAAFGSWTAARRAWVAEGNAWPGGEAAMAGEQLDAAIGLPDAEWCP